MRVAASADPIDDREHAAPPELDDRPTVNAIMPEWPAGAPERRTPWDS
jgi:hypothetical protein